MWTIVDWHDKYLQFFCNNGIVKNSILSLGKGALKVYPYQIILCPDYRKSVFFLKFFPLALPLA